MTALPGEADYSYATAINDRGQVLGNRGLQGTIWETRRRR
jgi:hypothetical protein